MRARYLVFATLLPVVPLTTLQGGAASPTDECRTTPAHQASTVDRWYYRVDRINHRKCWFVGPAGVKMRSVSRKHRPHHASVTYPTVKAVTAPRTARRADQLVLPIRAAVLVADSDHAIGQATSQQIAQPRVQNFIFAARWPDPVEVNRSIANAEELTEVAGAHAGSTVASKSNVPVKEPSHPSAQVASTTPAASPAIDSQVTLELLAGALVIAGVAGRMTFRRSGPRRHEFAAGAYTDKKWSPRDESILLVLPARPSLGCRLLILGISSGRPLQPILDLLPWRSEPSRNNLTRYRTLVCDELVRPLGQAESAYARRPTAPKILKRAV